MRLCLRLELESASELARSQGKCPVWGSQVYTQEACSLAQELGSLVWGCSLGCPPEQESKPRPQVEVELLPESQGSGPLGASSLGSHWDTPSRHPSCQVAMDCPTPMGKHPSAMDPEEWLVPRARPATRRGQEWAPRRRQQQQLKQQNMVLEELASSPVSEAFLVGLVQFLGLEALQGLGLLRQRLRPRQLLRLLSTELLGA